MSLVPIYLRMLILEVVGAHVSTLSCFLASILEYAVILF